MNDNKNKKYIVVLGDGMSDFINATDTPLSLAKKTTIDAISKNSTVGVVKTVADGLKPGSDIANLAVLGFDARKCYTGRSPLEAASIGIQLSDNDMSFRCNVVCLSDEKNYANKTMLDYSAGEITTEEARVLIDYLKDKLNLNNNCELHCGVSYRHCFVMRNYANEDTAFTPPHDISDKCIANYLPKGTDEKIFLDLQVKSYELLNAHPINLEREKQNKPKANSIWFWGAGTKPKIDNFYDKYKLKGAMISAVDLLKGIALCAGMTSIDVEGATGNIHTNYKGKVDAVINAISQHDYVYLHIEAPDECGHKGDFAQKQLAIEYLDSKVITPLIKQLNDKKVNYRLLFIPDHATPISLKTHSNDVVPFFIYDNNIQKNGCAYNEKNALATNNFIASGEELMRLFIF